MMRSVPISNYENRRRHSVSNNNNNNNNTANNNNIARTTSRNRYRYNRNRSCLSFSHRALLPLVLPILVVHRRLPFSSATVPTTVAAAAAAAAATASSSSPSSTSAFVFPSLLVNDNDHIRANKYKRNKHNNKIISIMSSSQQQQQQKQDLRRRKQQTQTQAATDNDGGNGGGEQPQPVPNHVQQHGTAAIAAVSMLVATAIAAASATTTTSAAPIFDNAPFVRANLVYVLITALGYGINCITTTHYHVDLLGSGAFAVAAALPLLSDAPLNPRILISSLAVVLWSIRLALFLFYRVIQTDGHDGRLNAILSSPRTAIQFWTFSMLWNIICSLPYTLGVAAINGAGNPFTTVVGTVLFGIGWIVESLSDYQKWNFKRRQRKGFCNVRLWNISQHPNWFGNLLLWCGIFVINAPALVEPVPSPLAETTISSMFALVWSYRRVLGALISPLFMWYLFYGQATGAILPDAYKATNTRYGYGTDEAYTKYIDTTPLIIPTVQSVLSKK